MLDERIAVLLVEVGQRRRVAGAAQVVALCLELGAQRAVVVDLAVEDGDDVAVLVRHRLVAGREVDHAEAAVAERAASERRGGAVIRAAMADRVARGADDRDVVRACRGGSEESTDAAHRRNRTAAGSASSTRSRLRRHAERL